MIGLKKNNFLKWRAWKLDQYFRRPAQCKTQWQNEGFETLSRNISGKVPVANVELRASLLPKRLKHFSKRAHCLKCCG